MFIVDYNHRSRPGFTPMLHASGREVAVLLVESDADAAPYLTPPVDGVKELTAEEFAAQFPGEGE